MEKKVYAEKIEKSENSENHSIRNKPLTPLERFIQRHEQMVDPLNPLLNGRLPAIYIEIRKEQQKEEISIVADFYKDSKSKTEKRIIALEESGYDVTDLREVIEQEREAQTQNNSNLASPLVVAATATPTFAKTFANILGRLSTAGAGALAEPTPAGELLWSAAVIGSAGYLGYKAYQAHNGEIEWGETVEGGNRSSNVKYLNDTMQKYKEQTFGTGILDNPIPETDKKISTTYPAGDYKPQNIYDNPITEFDKNYILTTPIQEGVAGNRLEYPDQTQDWRDYVYESNNNAEYEEYKKELRKKMSKPYVVDSDLQNIVNDNYRPNAKIGSGSTADAIRHEIKTGRKIGNKEHIEKGYNYKKALEKWLEKNPNARSGDRAAAENILEDLTDALKGR